MPRMEPPMTDKWKSPDMMMTYAWEAWGDIRSKLMSPGISDVKGFSVCEVTKGALVCYHMRLESNVFISIQFRAGCLI